jgi:hypothetical protein
MTTQPETTTLTLIEGGKASASRRRQPVPAELLPLFMRLRKHHHAISQAYKPLCEKQEDLEADWAIRDECFWQETLTILQALKAAMQPACTALIDDYTAEAPMGYIAVRFELMIALFHARSLIDEAGIETTSYLFVCTSTKVQHLQQRHDLKKKLQELGKEVQTVLDATGTRGQRKCIEEHQKAQRELAALCSR